MSNIKGTVEQVSSKKGSTHPKYGVSYSVGIKIDGEWYNGFFKKDAAALGLEAGVLVSFEVVQKGDYLNIDPKSLTVAEAGERQPASTGTKAAPRSGGGYNEAGVKVGHAINNAVQIAVAQGITGKDGKVNLKAIHGIALDILILGVRLEQQYQGAIEAAKAKFAEQDQGQQEQPPEDAPPPKEKAAPKGKAAANKAPPKQTPPPAQQQDAFEDDDIPF